MLGSLVNPLRSWRYALPLGALALGAGCRSGGGAPVTAPAAEGAAACLEQSDDTNELLSYLRDLTRDPGEFSRHERRTANLPMAPAVDIRAIRQPEVCAAAAAAFDRVRARGAPGAPVFVVQVGPQRYVVYEPNESVGEAGVLVTFDKTFSRALAQWRH